MNEIGVGEDVKLSKNGSSLYIAAPSPDIDISNNLIKHAVELLENIETVCCFNDPRFHMVNCLIFALSANRIII